MDWLLEQKLVDPAGFIALQSFMAFVTSCFESNHESFGKSTAPREFWQAHGLRHPHRLELLAAAVCGVGGLRRRCCRRHRVNQLTGVIVAGSSGNSGS